MDMVLYFRINGDFMLLIHTIMDFIIEKYDSEVRYLPHISMEEDYNYDYIGGDVFGAWIESFSRSKGYDLNLTREVYGFESDTRCRINIFTDTLHEGIRATYELAKIIENVFGEVLVNDDTSEVVYKKTSNETVFDQEFWKFDC